MIISEYSDIFTHLICVPTSSHLKKRDEKHSAPICSTHTCTAFYPLTRASMHSQKCINLVFITLFQRTVSLDVGHR